MKSFKEGLKRFRLKHSILFGICIMVIDILFLALPVEFVTEGVKNAMGLINSDVYLDQFCVNFLQFLFFVLVLAIIDKTIVLKNRGAGLVKTIVIAGVLVVLKLVQGILFAVTSEGLVFRAGDILVFALSMLFVGLEEEICSRVLIGGTLLEKFGTTKSGIWKAAIISSVIFGLAHFGNLIAGAELGETVTQVICAAIGGIFLMAVYLRSGNFWACALVHAFNDFILGVFVIASSGDAFGSLTVSGGFDITQILYAVVTQLLPAVYILREKKLPEVRKRMKPILEAGTK